MSLSRDEFDDDYVARLLAEDAKKTSSKYVSQGLSAFLPKKRAADAPKPNTRFLSHIVREADSHNAALKRKEEFEAERRLRALREADERPAKRRRADETDVSKRNRMFKDILGAAKSERFRDERKAGRSSHDRVSERRDRDRRSSSRDRRHGKHTRSRSRSPAERRRHVRRRNSSSVSDRERPSRRDRGTDANEGPSKIRSKRASLSPKNELPKEVRPRGRGAHKHRSAMDEHFKEGYDPSQDVSLDSDHNSDTEDWDLALEAMRDRAKYKQSQASRMRDAGFSEEEILKWEKGSSSKDPREGDVSAVKWTRKGEIREWDAGK